MHRLAHLIVLLALGAVARAELADVYLKDGLKLRGDVTQTETEVILRNIIGEVRIPRDAILRIELVKPTTAPVTRPAPADAPDEPDDEAGEAPTAGPLEPAPAITKADIQRLRLAELFLDDPPEQVRVQFLKRPRQRELAAEVLEELKKQGQVAPEVEETLLRGQPNEKLRVIVRETGLKFADRIEIQSDTEVFTNFRRRVLPLVAQSCARGGCHGGNAAHSFRFPAGVKTSDTYAYTVFALFDTMQSPSGQLIDRAAPGKSLLVNYLLPQNRAELPHPNRATRGPAFKPVLRDTSDPQYDQIIKWIESLRRPRPEYDLDWINPYGELPEAKAPYGVRDEPTTRPAP